MTATACDPGWSYRVAGVHATTDGRCENEIAPKVAFDVDAHWFAAGLHVACKITNSSPAVITLHPRGVHAVGSDGVGLELVHVRQAGAFTDAADAMDLAPTQSLTFEAVFEGDPFSPAVHRITMMHDGLLSSDQPVTYVLEKAAHER